MNRTEFAAALQQDGYEVVARTMEPNTTNPDTRTTSTPA
jgi:hypothetical protein